MKKTVDTETFAFQEQTELKWHVVDIWWYVASSVIALLAILGEFFWKKLESKIVLKNKQKKKTTPNIPLCLCRRHYTFSYKGKKKELNIYIILKKAKVYRKSFRCIIIIVIIDFAKQYNCQ